METFVSRLSSDQAFADLVMSDPAAAAAAAGLEAEDTAHVVRAVARTAAGAENFELVQRARAEVDAKGVDAFGSTSTDDLIRLGRAARATTRLCADRSDDALRLWGDIDEWRVRIAALRQANANWPAIAATELAKRPLPDDPERQHGVSLALGAFTGLAAIASAGVRKLSPAADSSTGHAEVPSGVETSPNHERPRRVPGAARGGG